MGVKDILGGSIKTKTVLTLQWLQLPSLGRGGTFRLKHVGSRTPYGVGGGTGLSALSAVSAQLLRGSCLPGHGWDETLSLWNIKKDFGSPGIWDESCRNHSSHPDRDVSSRSRKGLKDGVTHTVASGVPGSSSGECHRKSAATCSRCREGPRESKTGQMLYYKAIHLKRTYH